MSTNLKPVGMTAVGLIVTWAGMQALLQAATTVVGFLTACIGLLVGVLSLVWWIRRLRK